jgi:hypothetical protein
MSKKLIKGVIYDDVDMQEMKEEMFETMEECYSVDDDYLKSIPATQSMMKQGCEFEAVRQYYQTMDAIAALTRYNFDTGVTHNLIIPKEALSDGLVDELEKVDLGKDLLSDYGNRHYETHHKEDIYPEEFIKGEDESLLKFVDNELRKLPAEQLIAIPKDSELGRAITKLVSAS